MFRNQLLIVLRHWLRYKADTLIKVVSLTAGITGCLLILLFVQHEWRYDNFHTNKNIHRLLGGWDSAITAGPIASYAAEQVSGVTGYVRLMQEEGTVQRQDQFFKEKLIFADTNFFSFFTFPLKTGNPTHALDNPHSIVLTPKTARRYFGTLDVLGKTLRIRLEKDSAFSDFTVTGLTETLPTNTTLPFTLLLSMKLVKPVAATIGKDNWRTGDVNAYVSLDPQANQAEVEHLLNQQIEELLGEEQSYHLQPLPQVHLGKSVFAEIIPPVDARYLYIAGSVALILLVIACVNFTTLTLGRSSHRSREVGVRKTLGASRFQLMRQFLGESFLLTVVITLSSFGLAYILLPHFSQLLGQSIAISPGDPQLLALLAGVVLTAGIIAGFYPAWVLSDLPAASVLKGQTMVNRRHRLIGGLVTLQFVGTIALVAGSISMHRQLSLLQNKELGFEESYVLRVEVPFRQSNRLFQQFQSQVSSLSEVRDITASWQLFGHEAAGVGYQELPYKIEGHEIRASALAVGPDFLETTQIELAQGETFTDWSDSPPKQLIVNESFVKMMNWDNPLGKRFGGFLFEDSEIIGVVKDFHFLSLHQPITPLIIHPSATYSNIYVRIASGQIPSTIEKLEQQWKTVTEDIPFVFHFLDEDIARQYEAEQRWANVITYTSLLVVFIACLGLFGMASLLTQQRTKEIGIRKVLGASLANLLVLLCQDYMKLLAIALLIAVPLANYFVQEWLDSFAYRTSISWWIYAIIGIGILLMALLTISGQTLKAATQNPVDSLRYE